jgi:hypothetical protein
MFDGVTGAIIHSDRIELRLVEGQRGDDNLAGAGLAFGSGGPGLSPTPWVNPRNALDADNSGDVAALDALILINEINRTGPRDLPVVPATSERLPPYLDTNGDNRLEAADVLNVVNLLNSSAAGEGEGDGVWPGVTPTAAPAVGSYLGDRTSMAVEFAPVNPGLPAHEAWGGGHRRDTSAWTVSSSQASDRHDHPKRLGPAASWSPPTLAEGDLERALDEIAADVAWEWAG